MNPTETTSENDVGRTRPLVWVRQLILYETIAPTVEIAKVPFSTGLNVIQGEANGRDEAFESGHGIGKTTICRLIRYCLGENSFGQKHLVGEVRHCFPHAHVGAIIVLDGIDWVVLRHLGSRGRNCAMEGGSLDALIGSEDPPRFETFIGRLNSLLLADVPVAESLSSGQALQWPHVLAMCSRDQESRYDCFWNWRHTRSESGTPKFSKPKVDAGLCVRAVVGLLDPAEARLRSKLEELEAKLEQTRSEIKDKRAEPTFHITRLRKSLVTDCGVHDASHAQLDEQSFFGLQEAVTKRLEALRQEVAQIEEQLPPLDRQINLAAASLLEPAELSEQLKAASEVTVEGNDVLLGEIEKLRSIRQFIRDAEAALCRYGDVLIGQCHIVQDRREGVEQQLREQQRAVLPTVSEREQRAARLAEQAERQQSVIGRIQQQLDGLNRQKNDLLERRRNLNDQMRRIPSMLGELLDWHATLEGVKPNTALQSLETAVTSTEVEIDGSKKQLASLITAQVERAKLFESRFDGIVKQTLTKDFKGVIEIEEDGINFRIMRGESLSGEAYETLAVLLGDVALLFESDRPHVHHPGFLLHDSPREADLNLLIYQRLLDGADAQMRKAEQHGNTPCQYIVTTTTLPSKALQDKAVTRIKLSSGPGSLFGRQLEAAKPAAASTSLFVTKEEE